MKSLRYLFVSVCFVATALSAMAAPPGKRVFPAFRHSADFGSRKVEDKIALVCKECDAAIAGNGKTMELCKEGRTVVCSACETKTRIVRRGPRGQLGGTRTEIRHVNANGEDCVFFAKLED